MHRKIGIEIETLFITNQNLFLNLYIEKPRVREEKLPERIANWLLQEYLQAGLKPKTCQWQ